MGDDSLIPWSRTWTRTDSRPVHWFDRDFTSPDQRTLAQWADEPLLVLVGQGGAGKSTEIGTEHRRIGDASILIEARKSDLGTVRDLIDGFLNRGLPDPLVVWIDGLDEAQDPVDVLKETSGAIKARLGLKNSECSVHYRIATRPLRWDQRWMISFQTVPPTQTPPTPVIIELEALTPEQLGEACESREVPTEAFTDELVRTRLDSSARQPVMLRMLLDQYKEEQRLPDSSGELYERLVTRDIDSAIQREFGRHPPTSLRKQARQALGFIALATVFTAKPSFRLRSSESKDDALNLGDHLRSLSPSDNSAVRQVIESLSDLVTSQRDGRMRFSHRSIEEYLASRTLADSTLTDDDLYRKLTVEDHVAPHLVGVCSWLVQRRHGLKDRVARNPVVALQSDPELFTPEHHARELVRQLDRQEVLTSTYGIADILRRIDRDARQRVIQEILSESVPQIRSGHVALLVARMGRHKDLAPAIMKWVLHKAVPFELRAEALHSLAQLDKPRAVQAARQVTQDTGVTRASSDLWRNACATLAEFDPSLTSQEFFGLLESLGSSEAYVSSSRLIKDFRAPLEDRGWLTDTLEWLTTLSEEDSEALDILDLGDVVWEWFLPLLQREDESARRLVVRLLETRATQYLQVYDGNARYQTPAYGPLLVDALLEYWTPKNKYHLHRLRWLFASHWRQVLTRLVETTSETVRGNAASALYHSLELDDVEQTSTVFEAIASRTPSEREYLEGFFPQLYGSSKFDEETQAAMAPPRDTEEPSAGREDLPDPIHAIQTHLERDPHGAHQIWPWIYLELGRPRGSRRWEYFQAHNIQRLVNWPHLDHATQNQVMNMAFQALHHEPPDSPLASLLQTGKTNLHHQASAALMSILQCGAFVQSELPDTVWRTWLPLTLAGVGPSNVSSTCDNTHDDNSTTTTDADRQALAEALTYAMDHHPDTTKAALTHILAKSPNQHVTRAVLEHMVAGRESHGAAYARVLRSVLDSHIDSVQAPKLLFQALPLLGSGAMIRPWLHNLRTTTPQQSSAQALFLGVFLQMGGEEDLEPFKDDILARPRLLADAIGHAASSDELGRSATRRANKNWQPWYRRAPRDFLGVVLYLVFQARYGASPNHEPSEVAELIIFASSTLWSLLGDGLPSRARPYDPGDVLKIIEPLCDLAPDDSDLRRLKTSARQQYVRSHWQEPSLDQLLEWSQAPEDVVASLRGALERVNKQRPDVLAQVLGHSSVSDMICDVICKAASDVIERFAHRLAGGQENDFTDLLDLSIAPRIAWLGWTTQPQSRGGLSEGGTAGQQRGGTGSRDLVIRHEEQRLAVVEALVLNAVRTDRIRTHRDKLVNEYDPLTVQHYVLLVYYTGTTKGFHDFADRYATSEVHDNGGDTLAPSTLELDHPEAMRVLIETREGKTIHHMLLDVSLGRDAS